MGNIVHLNDKSNVVESYAIQTCSRIDSVWKVFVCFSRYSYVKHWVPFVTGCFQCRITYWSLKLSKTAFFNKCSYLHIYKPTSIFKAHGNPFNFQGAAFHSTSLSIDRSKLKSKNKSRLGDHTLPKESIIEQTSNYITQNTAFLVIWFYRFLIIYSYEKNNHPSWPKSTPKEFWFEQLILPKDASTQVTTFLRIFYFNSRIFTVTFIISS